jgi:hypothetical protein
VHVDETLRDFAYGYEKEGEDRSKRIKNEFGKVIETSQPLKIVYEEAKKATILTPQLEALKNFYENKLLREYMKSDSNT